MLFPSLIKQRVELLRCFERGRKLCFGIKSFRNITSIQAREKKWLLFLYSSCSSQSYWSYQSNQPTPLVALCRLEDTLHSRTLYFESKRASGRDGSKISHQGNSYLIPSINVLSAVWCIISFFSVVLSLKRGEVGLLDSFTSASSWISLLVWHVTVAVGETGEKRATFQCHDEKPQSMQPWYSRLPNEWKVCGSNPAPSRPSLCPWPRHLTQNCSQWGRRRFALQQPPFSVGMSEWEAFVKHLGVPLRY